MFNFNTSKFIASLVLCHAAGGIGTIFTSRAITEWYAFLDKPAFSPPNWVFGPVWTTLYTLMAIALYLVWKKGTERADVRLAANFFLFHLVLNALWSGLFFGLRNPFVGLIGILALWLAVAYSLRLFSKINKWAAGLLVPYLIWVSFATVLNYSIWRLN